MPQAQIKQELHSQTGFPSWSYIYHNTMYFIYIYTLYFKNVHYISKAFNVPFHPTPLLPLVSDEFFSTNSGTLSKQIF